MAGNEQDRLTHSYKRSTRTRRAYELHEQESEIMLRSARQSIEGAVRPLRTVLDDAPGPTQIEPLQPTPVSADQPPAYLLETSAEKVLRAKAKDQIDEYYKTHPEADEAGNVNVTKDQREQTVRDMAPLTNVLLPLAYLNLLKEPINDKNIEPNLGVFAHGRDDARLRSAKFMTDLRTSVRKMGVGIYRDLVETTDKVEGQDVLGEIDSSLAVDGLVIAGDSEEREVPLQKGDLNVRLLAGGKNEVVKLSDEERKVAASDVQRLKSNLYHFSTFGLAFESLLRPRERSELTQEYLDTFSYTSSATRYMPHAPEMDGDPIRAEFNYRFETASNFIFRMRDRSTGTSISIRLFPDEYIDYGEKFRSLSGMNVQEAREEIHRRANGSKAWRGKDSIDPAAVIDDAMKTRREISLGITVSAPGMEPVAMMGTYYERRIAEGKQPGFKLTLPELSRHTVFLPVGEPITSVNGKNKKVELFSSTQQLARDLAGLEVKTSTR